MKCVCPGEWWHKPEMLQGLSVAERAQSGCQDGTRDVIYYCVKTDRQFKLIYTFSVYAYCSLVNMKYCPETHPAVSALGSNHQWQWICTEKQVLQTCLHTAQLSEGFLQISSGLNTHLLLWCLTHTVPVQFHLKEECALGDCSTMWTKTQ